ncbi:hypothetical protein ACP70R_036708 [Stipagrostis hirtigluma subsp. patula]
MRKSGGGGCLGAPVRALSRACDSACDLYVRGMSGCARRMPSGAAAGAVGRGFGRSATSLRLRTSSDCADDLVRAAARQHRRVAAEPVEAVNGAGAGKKGGAALISVTAPAAMMASPRRKGAAATMGTIAEDAPCEFGPDGACRAPPGGFCAMKARRQVFAR